MCKCVHTDVCVLCVKEKELNSEGKKGGKSFSASHPPLSAAHKANSAESALPIHLLF